MVGESLSQRGGLLKIGAKVQKWENSTISYITHTKHRIYQGMYERFNIVAERVT